MRTDHHVQHTPPLWPGSVLRQWRGGFSRRIVTWASYTTCNSLPKTVGWDLVLTVQRSDIYNRLLSDSLIETGKTNAVWLLCSRPIKCHVGVKWKHVMSLRRIIQNACVIVRPSVQWNAHRHAQRVRWCGSVLTPWLFKSITVNNRTCRVFHGEPQSHQCHFLPPSLVQWWWWWRYGKNIEQILAVFVNLVYIFFFWIEKHAHDRQFKIIIELYEDNKSWTDWKISKLELDLHLSSSLTFCDATSHCSTLMDSPD